MPGDHVPRCTAHSLEFQGVNKSLPIDPARCPRPLDRERIVIGDQERSDRIGVSEQDIHEPGVEDRHPRIGLIGRSLPLPSPDELKPVPRMIDAGDVAVFRLPLLRLSQPSRAMNPLLVLVDPEIEVA